MVQNVYGMYDKQSGRVLRIIFADNDSTLCRDNVPGDLRSEKNPLGLPFNDLGYKYLATYDTEALTFENTECIRDVDILNSYNFKVERPMENKDVSEPLPGEVPIQNK